MAQQQIKGSTGLLGSGSNPAGTLETYEVPGSATVEPISASVTFDGTNASGPFLPCLTFKTITGAIIARCPAPEVAAGDTAEVSWFPGVVNSSTGVTLSYSAALGLQAVSQSLNDAGFTGGGVNPGGGDDVRLTLMEEIPPTGRITGAAISLESLGAVPSGTAQLGLATFSGSEVATYVAVTTDISASLTSGALGIRRFSFTSPYNSDGRKPLWVALAFTAAWGTDPFVTGLNSSGALARANSGYYRPRYLSLAAGAGTLSLGGMQSTWNAGPSQLIWAGIY